MSPALERAFELIEERSDRYLALLCDLIARPSRTGHLDEVAEVADYLVGLLGGEGWEAEAVPVDGLAPVVHARRPAPAGGRTLLAYSHYDVISPEPLSEWTRDPFGAERVDGRIYGRGSTDAKANLLALVLAADVLTEVGGECPVGVELILDGDEERGSPGIPVFLDEHGDRIRPDAALSFDGAVDATGVPKIGLGTAGMVAVELTCRGAPRELHSAKARLFPNPAWRLVWALASIMDPEGRVLIDGFEEVIVPPTEGDRQLMTAMPWDDTKQLAEAGVGAFLGGVSGVDAVERLLYRPGLAICGISGGYTGEGPKAVIPREASAKLEIRIVPDQTPDGVLEQLRDHLARRGFVDVDIDVHALVETAKTDPEADVVQATVTAATGLYGPPMLKPTEEYAGRQGAWLGDRLGVPGVQTGVGPPNNNSHAADEFVTEEHFLKGIKYAAAVYHHYGAGG